ncbi:MAG: hypothetical protein WA862_11565 [Solirubrobacterales bacterium]
MVNATAMFRSVRRVGEPQMDVLLREATTVGGIANLIGAAAIVRFFPGATALDKLLAVLLVLSTRGATRPNPLFEAVVKQVIDRLLSSLADQRGSLIPVVSVFIVYNVVCILLVGAG